MKIFIILTILVSGLSVWGGSVLTVPTEVGHTVKILDQTTSTGVREVPIKRSIASSNNPPPSCNPEEAQCFEGLNRGSGTTEATTIAGGTTATNSSLKTSEITTSKARSFNLPGTNTSPSTDTNLDTPNSGPGGNKHKVGN